MSAANETSTESSGVISGKLDGDLSNVSSIEAVRISDGAKFSGSITPSTAKVNALTATGANFSVSVPVGNSYVVNINSVNNQPVVTLQFPANTAGTATTSTLNVPTPTTTTGTQINMGTVTVPVGAGAGGAATTVAPTTNPLEHVDFDHDGLHDLDDADDDNNGIDDINDDVNHHSSSSHGSDDINDDHNDDLNDDHSTEVETPEKPEKPEKPEVVS